MVSGEFCAVRVEVKNSSRGVPSALIAEQMPGTFASC